MKRLANLKSSNTVGNTPISQKRINTSANTKSKKTSALNNHPYDLPGRPDTLSQRPSNGHLSFSEPLSSERSGYTASTASRGSVPPSQDGPPPGGLKSAAPTVSTNGETAASDAAFSKAGTSGTAAKTDGGRDSTFSSPAPSVRSLTTTLTTVHSAITSNANPSTQTASQNGLSSQHPTNYSQPFTTSPPPTAVPTHLIPHNQPTTYNSAIANNALTDDASILTLASSSKRRRRNSLDTNASVRALAPQSVWGGSRESLPLSVLSGNAPEPSGSIYNAQGSLARSTVAGLASAERASVYSSSGIAPALTSERNSYIAAKPTTGDGASIRSGLHGRNDSLTNSLGPNAVNHSPLASPATTVGAGPPGRVSRSGSGWGEVPGEDNEEEEGEGEEETSSEVDASRDEKHDRSDSVANGSI